MNVTEADWDFLPEILSRWLVRGESGVPFDLDGIRRNHLEAFAYYFAKDTLTTELQREFGAVYQAQSIRSLRLEHAVRQLETLFQTHNVRFVWIKGADLRRGSIYPAHFGCRDCARMQSA